MKLVPAARDGATRESYNFLREYVPQCTSGNPYGYEDMPSLGPEPGQASWMTFFLFFRRPNLNRLV